MNLKIPKHLFCLIGRKKQLIFLFVMKKMMIEILNPIITSIIVAMLGERLQKVI